MVSQKKSLEVAEDDAEDIELPPPMKIQEHLFGTAAQEETSEDMAKKLVRQCTMIGQLNLPTRSPVLKGHSFLVLSYKISYDLMVFGV